MNKGCEGCDAKCCKHVAIEIDNPESLEDFEDIKWYVCHKNVNVFVDEDYQWNLEFLTPCEHLGEDNKCKSYEFRPQICRDYDNEDCTFNNKDYVEKYIFKNIQDIEDYIQNVFEKGEHVVLECEDEEEEEDEI